MHILLLQFKFHFHEIKRGTSGINVFCLLDWGFVVFSFFPFLACVEICGTLVIFQDSHLV